MTQQIDEDETPIPLGKGAVFVPRMSDPQLEPDVQIADSIGKVVLTGKPGKKYCLIPGTYSVRLGNGTTKQRIEKWVVVDEGRTTPLFPTWSGLQIDVVSESNIPFKGSYEMVRLDEFEPFGRTYGRDPNQGERVKTWILNPGLYKIFGAGGSYNAVSSFVTVRLLPGELTRFSVVEDSATGKILSGGVTLTGEASRKITSHWKYGLDMGGSILFNTSNDTNNSAIVFLTNIRVNHAQSKGEWDTKFFFDEELNFSNFKICGHQQHCRRFQDVFAVHMAVFALARAIWADAVRNQFLSRVRPVRLESSQHHLFLLTRPGGLGGHRSRFGFQVKNAQAIPVSPRPSTRRRRQCRRDHVRRVRREIQAWLRVLAAQHLGPVPGRNFRFERGKSKGRDFRLPSFRQTRSIPF